MFAAGPAAAAAAAVPTRPYSGGGVKISSSYAWHRTHSPATTVMRSHTKQNLRAAGLRADADCVADGDDGDMRCGRGRCGRDDGVVDRVRAANACTLERPGLEPWSSNELGGGDALCVLNTLGGPGVGVSSGVSKERLGSPPTLLLSYSLPGL